MKNHSLISSLYAALVLSACFIQGYSLPSKSLQRWGHSLSEAGHPKYKAHNSGSHRRNSPGSSVRPPRTSAMPLMMPPSNPQPRRSPVCWPQRWSSPPRSSLSSLASSPGRPGPARLTGWTGLIWMERILSPGGTSSTSDWRSSWPSCPHSPPLRSLTETGSRWEIFSREVAPVISSNLSLSSCSPSWEPSSRVWQAAMTAPRCPWWPSKPLKCSDWSSRWPRLSLHPWARGVSTRELELDPRPEPVLW